MDSSPAVAWRPNPKQAEFLAASEDEVLYGGAAGGGKSDALLLDVLGIQQGALEYRSYQGILFRRTYKELSDLIDRSRELYSQWCPGAKYHQGDHVWTFPSGARIELGHMQHENDRFKYRGRAFQYEGWDELTLFPSPVCFEYLGSRLRSTETSLQCYSRATTNPDGPGQAWVKKRWAIPNEGTATRFEVAVKDEVTGIEYVQTRRFIPARLDDNPYLTATPDYRIKLLKMPPDEREALLRGRWDAIPIRGAYYGEDIAKARREGRICAVPYQRGVPVDTYWDLGHSDSTSIVFHQPVAMQDRILAGYENSGQALDHYSKYLMDQEYVYGTHFLPHDAGYTRLGKDEANTKPWIEMLQDLMPNHRFEIVDRVDDVSRGIQQTRNAFGSLWIDENKCRDLIAALEAYRKQWDDKLQVYRDKPLHDWASNYADALRQFGQKRAVGIVRRGQPDTDDADDDWRTI